jgi:uncharacterized protein (DUF58 family)
MGNRGATHSGRRMWRIRLTVWRLLGALLIVLAVLGAVQHNWVGTAFWLALGLALEYASTRSARDAAPPSGGRRPHAES